MTEGRQKRLQLSNKIVGRALHRYREVTGSNPVEVLNFFQASLRNCINCFHCDHHFFIFKIFINTANNPHLIYKKNRETLLAYLLRTKVSCKAAEIAVTRSLKAQSFFVYHATYKAFFKKKFHLLNFF